MSEQTTTQAAAIVSNEKQTSALKPSDEPAALALAASQGDPLSGHVGHLDESQQQCLQAFKALLFAQGLYKPDPVPTHDEATLLRYLRARRWDAQAALKQLKEADHWRHTYHVDEFFLTHEIQSYEEARRVYPCWTGRRTRKGIPYYIYKVAHLDKKTMQKHLDNGHHHKKHGRHHGKRPPSVVALYESLLQLVLPMASKLEDRPHPETPVTASCNIVDISGVSLMQFFGLRGHLGDASALATARYPETLDSILVIGAPPYVETVWSFISQWFDANTRAKISILSNDKEATYKRLTELIDPQDIPEDYGGTMKWNFGDLPNLDPALVRSYGLDNTKWPIGPIKLEGNDIVALGTFADGKPRREVVGTFRSATPQQA